jgi:hypothetical protein
MEGFAQEDTGNTDGAVAQQRDANPASPAEKEGEPRGLAPCGEGRLGADAAAPAPPRPQGSDSDEAGEVDGEEPIEAHVAADISTVREVAAPDQEKVKSGSQPADRKTSASRKEVGEADEDKANAPTPGKECERTPQADAKASAIVEAAGTLAGGEVTEEGTRDRIGVDDKEVDGAGKDKHRDKSERRGRDEDKASESKRGSKKSKASGRRSRSRSKPRSGMHKRRRSRTRSRSRSSTRRSPPRGIDRRMQGPPMGAGCLLATAHTADSSKAAPPATRQTGAHGMAEGNAPSSGGRSAFAAGTCLKLSGATICQEVKS